MTIDDFPVGASNQQELDIMALAREAHKIFDNAIVDMPDEMTFDNGTTGKLGCKKGCMHCCTILVSISVSEIFLIYGYVFNHPQDVREKIRQKIIASAPKAANKGISQRSIERLNCPFLDENGSCLVYPARPLSCRSYVSYERETCERSAKNPRDKIKLNFPQRPFETRDELYRQMFFNEMSINLPSDSYEMIQAFYIFMQTPHALQRIINGERILDPAITKL